MILSYSKNFRESQSMRAVGYYYLALEIVGVSNEFISLWTIPIS